ncbi:Reverse transcriptase (RNA-dependent DNA polymerase) [Paraburkholderia ribeironis]|uniref:RNA-directed DNA polymerase n=1 Tax=Paraburkholderia ribeironis TaxID=1247936 RepID=A0A1N7RVP4_9BURK|nr:reverse transcriptase domain-containing protein [Paraburkholderia ribeironis]SIT38803.1 Reverse transcriptase (RNA-dependent DNA polymerase) [Paraburkholderia ribeironis]
MTKKPLQFLFDAMYHNKQSFADFATGDIGRHLSARQITDDAGKKRDVFVPDKVLRKYHSFLNLFVFNYLSVNTAVVFSYRKGTNAADAVRSHASSRHFYQADISSFFPSITADIVRRSILRDEAQTPVEDLGDYLDRIIDLVTIDGTLPIGFSTSPVISNTALLPFDDAFAAHCLRNGLIYTRYSDDITVSSQEKAPLLALDAVIQDLLCRCNLPEMRLNERKTKISSTGRKIKILGMVVLPNGVVTLDAKVKNRIETLLHLYVRNQLALQEVMKADLVESAETLSGLLNYANTVDQGYLDKLRRKYGVTVVDTLVHQPKRTDSKKDK